MFEPSKNLRTNEKTKKVFWGTSHPTTSSLNGKERKSHVRKAKANKNSDCISNLEIKTKDLNLSTKQKDRIRLKVTIKRKRQINSKNKIKTYEFNERSFISSREVTFRWERANKKPCNDVVV